MNHMEALEMHASERYLLGELSTLETEAFEEHYFGCTDCVADLEAATALVANARAVFQQEAAPARRTAAVHQESWLSAWKDLLLAGFRQRLALAATSLASVVLGGVCLYQALVSIPQLQQAALTANTAFALNTFALAGRARGDEPTISIPRDTRSFAIYFDADPQAAYPEYRCVLKDRQGAVRFTVRAAAAAPGQPITVLLPAQKLQPGRYDLIVDGLRGEQAAAGISTYPFTLQFK